MRSIARAALVVTLLVAPAVGLVGAPAAGGVPDGEWTVDDPASHGIDATTLDRARQYAFAAGQNTQGVVVVHDGVIVGEWYAPGEDEDSWAASWSVAKSFAGALIGIGLDEGLIPSIDEPMTTYYPEWIGTPRETITLRHVLHMESGLNWDEDYSPAALATSEIINMLSAQPDQQAFATSRPALVPPGTRFNYSSGDSMLLSGVIEQATGLKVEDYARTRLFEPIGIDPVDWWEDAGGHNLTYCCVDTTSRDFARFGLLYLEGGTWGAEQVVPASWVRDSITDTSATYGGYGYQWWLDLDPGGSLPPYFSARGFDGQYIYVVPDLDLVVVRNGLYTKSPCPPVADPNLLSYYPPMGLVDGQGTVGPGDWSDYRFLAPIVESITGVPVSISRSPDDDRAGTAAEATPEQPSAPAAATGPLTESCDNVTGPPARPGPPTPHTPTAPAGPVSATPTFTG